MALSLLPIGLLALPPLLSGWTLDTALHSTDLESSDRLGFSVAMDGDTLVLGAWEEDSVAQDAGAAYVFVDVGGTWIQQAKLTASDGGPADRFGEAVAIDGDTIVVGVPDHDLAGTVDAGAAYVFERSGVTWSESAKLTIAGALQGDRMGIDVAVSGDTVLAGAPWRGGGGRAYVYTGTGGTWSLQAELVAADTAAADEFATGVALDGNRAAVGALGDDDNGSFSGSVYLFERSGGAWTEGQKVLASDGVAGDWFGRSVGLDGDLLVVGAYGVDAVGFTSGAAYAFERTGGSYLETGKLIPADAGSGHRFGFSVDAAGDLAVVGAYFHSGPFGSAGAAYVFRDQGATWVEEELLLAPSPGSGDYTGYDVAASGARVLVGAPFASAPFLFGSGEAYLFDSCPSIAAAEVVRLGTPANPDALRPGLTSGPVSGAVWDPWIDHGTFQPTAVLDLLGVTPGSANLPLPPLGTVLCDLSQPLKLVTTPVGVPFALPVPSSCTLIGTAWTAQGISVDPGGGLHLTGALDIVLGSF